MKVQIKKIVKRNSFLHHKPIILLSGVFVISLLPFLASAKEEVGVFENQKLQERLLDDYYLTFEDNKIQVRPELFSSWDISLVKDLSKQSEIENIDYCPETFKGVSICDLTYTQDEKTHIKKIAHFYIYPEKIDNVLNDIETQIEKNPQDGIIEMDENQKLRIIKKSNYGYKLNKNRSKEKILKEFKSLEPANEIGLIVETVRPTISTDHLEELGQMELIGHGESNFIGSPKNRIHNITVAMEKFRGTLIAPDEEFSFVKILGPVDEDSGYKEELVIKKGETIPEFGGGVCQVSTTVFRAALNTGLKITERRNHAYPVQYYAPQGTDATIYIPKPDFRFVNDTKSYILLQPRMDGHMLYFDVYGTSDGRKVEIDGPKVTARTPDGGLRTTLFQRVLDKNGELIREDEFKSFYENPDKYH